MRNKSKVKKLQILGLQFDRIVKMIEKYSKSGPNLVYITFYIINH